MRPTAQIVQALAPRGVLRAGINLSNFLLVSSKTARGEPAGVSPDVCGRLAAALGVDLELVPYENPGLLADAAASDEWDVGLIGAEPARAETICFTAPYCEIEATYAVRNAALDAISKVDATGVTIAVSKRAAYCLWLEANLERATLRTTDEPGLALSRQLFESDPSFDAIAGLRPWLLAQNIPDTTILDGRFMTVQQAIGVPRARGDGGASLFLERFVAELTADGTIQELIDKHDVSHGLSVAHA